MALVIILLLFVANGVFAMAEMAIIASRQVRLEARAEAGSKGAKTALRLKRDPGRFLSTGQTGGTVIPIALILSHFTWISPALDAGIAFVLGVSITTFFSLIIGELVPKQIALRRAEAIAVASARPFAVISKVVLPAVALLDITTRLVLRLIGMHRIEREKVSEQEVRTLIAEGTEHGVFHPSEGAMVGRVLRFADRPVRSIMTPRADMVWIDLEANRDEIGKVVAESRHTRIPVGRSVENIVGVVHIRDLFAHSLRGEPLKLGESVTSIPAVYDAIPVLQTLEILRESGSRMALVVDEYGGVEGIVTLTDVLEAIVGELPSAGRSEKP